jgi:hypothetical protein
MLCLLLEYCKVKMLQASFNQPDIFILKPYPSGEGFNAIKLRD